MILDKAALINELEFKAVRSSGPGGQHVNKVSSRIELQFDLINSEVLTDKQKVVLKSKLSSRLTKKGILILSCDDSRSQHRNKELVVRRFLELIRVALIPPKKRKPTTVSKAVKRKRMQSKIRHSEKKQQRKKPDIGD